jgi:hypothetical protein
MKAATNIFDRVYERDNVEMPVIDEPAVAFITRPPVDEEEIVHLPPMRNTMYHYMQLFLSKKRELWEKMGIVVPSVTEAGLLTRSNMSDADRDKFFFAEVKKQNRVEEMAKLVEELLASQK